MTDSRSRRRRDPTTPKRKPGRPSFEPTEEMREAVSIMAGCGIPVEMIARIVVPGGIARHTLEKYFSEELETGHAKANAAIAETLFRKALSGDATCMIFWLKTRARWKETAAHELTGKDGGALTVQVVRFVDDQAAE